MLTDRLRTYIREHHWGMLATFLVMTGGTAYALEGTNTVNSGDIINREVKTVDLADGAVTATKLRGPEAWHEVAPGSTGSDACANPNTTGVFCSSTDILFTPWKNFGGGLAKAAFYKDQLGIVHLRGTVVPHTTVQSSSAERYPIFRLPAGYRPESTRIFPIIGRDTDGHEVAAGRVDVEAGGMVVLELDCLVSATDCSANTGYISLDGIDFRPDE